MKKYHDNIMTNVRMLRRFLSGHLPTNDAHVSGQYLTGYAGIERGESERRRRSILAFVVEKNRKRLYIPE